MRFVFRYFLLALWAVGAPSLFAQASAVPGKDATSAIKMMFRSTGGTQFLDASTATISAVHGASLSAAQGFSDNTFMSLFLSAATAGSGAAASSGEPSRKSVVMETRTWDGAFVDGRAPTSLGGVTVRINGQPGFISFTGRAQDLGTDFDLINVISPDTGMLGPVMVEIDSQISTVIPSVIDIRSHAPGFFPFGQGGRRYIAAVENNGEAFLAPPSIFEGLLDQLALPVRKARTGDIVQFFGTGFGPTDPSFPAGTLPTGIGNLVDDVRVTIGGMPTTLFFGGATSQFAGALQFVIEVPALTDGDHEIVASVAGVSSQAGLFLSVDNSVVAGQ